MGARGQYPRQYPHTFDIVAVAVVVVVVVVPTSHVIRTTFRG